jgi:hypothetical protein
MGHFSVALKMSVSAVNPETVKINSNKHCLCEMGFDFFFRHSYFTFLTTILTKL